LPWRLLKVIATGRALRIEFDMGDDSCVLPLGIVVLESRTSVEPVALSKDLVRAGTTRSGVPIACPSVLAVGVGVVRPASPLENRELLHAPISPGWSQELLDRTCCPRSPGR
jgi:hypothetical protein